MQTNAQYERGLPKHPTDSELSAFGSHLNVFRRNHEQLQDEYGSNYGREICLDFTEDIIMVRDYLLEKLGRSDAACRRHTTWSEMAERDLDREQVGFHKMLESEQGLVSETG